MNPQHDPETTAQEVKNLISPEPPLSEPLHALSQAAERLQTWASDTAASVAKRPTMSPREALTDKLVGERLLSEVLSTAAPVIGELGAVAGGGQ